MASFFTPVSQKEAERTIWQERAPDDDTPSTLLVGKYSPKDPSDKPKPPSPIRQKVAAFDFVSVPSCIFVPPAESQL